MARRNRSRGRRYSAAEKRKILGTARRLGLTARQVSRRFGVSPITFYRWRGPVRKTARGHARAQMAQVREKVRDQVRRVLPRVIRQEVDRYVNQLLARAPGSRRRRR